MKVVLETDAGHKVAKESLARLEKLQAEKMEAMKEEAIGEGPHEGPGSVCDIVFFEGVYPERCQVWSISSVTNLLQHDRGLYLEQLSRASVPFAYS